MSTSKIAIDIDSDNKYEKAKKDLIQALKSFQELPMPDKERLLHELIGTTNMAVMCNIIRRNFER